MIREASSTIQGEQAVSSWYALLVTFKKIYD